ncbi:restriction endonuclease subunit S [uncultured Flavobacterium sp.]|uniref:restriction endonuclease subunit S n=1 Tax=uncultured Flavobacterium sp. TaxID=165435 RepID=UPI00259205D6|nr:restriction endonuclease subunit S [uncultured Flavobacterium sp.]
MERISKLMNEFYFHEKFGEVPLGWEVKSIDKCFDFFPTASFSRAVLTENGECGYIHYGDIHTKFHRFLDLDKCKVPYVSSEMANRFTKLKEGDLIISDASEDYEGVGKSVEVLNAKNKSIISGLHTLHLRPKEGEFIIGFPGYLLNHNKVRLHILRSATGIKVYSVSKSALKRVLLPKPPKPEQTAIVTILSKVDEAIEATQNSIKAAEKLKKAMMQNLLTGKLKPDGTWRTDDEFYVDEKFGKVPVGWEVARVKDYGFVQTGKTPPTAESNVFSEIENESRYPFITPGDLGESKFVSTSERFVTEKGIRYSYKLPINSICIVCIGSTIGKIGITKTEACTNQQINALIANENNSGEFFFYMMEYRKPHFKEIAGINATPQINKSGFNKYKLLRPKEKSEQEEIVSQLNSFDEENITKQSKIHTLQRLKKSLMQNLLTGKLRLDVEKVNKLLSEQAL